MRLVINFIFIIIIFQSCDNNNGGWVLPPISPLKIGFTDTNELYDRIERDSIHYGYWIDSLVYYYNDKGEKIYQNKYIIISIKFSFYPYYCINLGEISEKSAGSAKIKYWYIKWPKGKIDTLFADYYTDTIGPNSCSCSTPLKVIKLNGNNYIEKTDYNNNGIFVFDW